MGHTAECIDMLKGQHLFGHNLKGYGVHREPRLPDYMVCPPLMLPVFPPEREAQEHA